MTDLRGILTALPTPFTPDAAVDETTLRALVDRSVAGGVHGVSVCGSRRYHVSSSWPVRCSRATCADTAPLLHTRSSGCIA